MQEIKVENIIISKQPEDSENFEKLLRIAKQKKINLIVVNKGDRINIETEIYFDILWPDSNNFISENKLNNNSIVCKLNYRGFSMLFTGDIEEKAETEILRQYQKKLELLKSTVLKVGHHGSKTSSTQALLEAVNPQVAIIGVGENNNFGHPNSEVIERLENMRYKHLSNR